jgi:ABC-type glutathione transport system ATPase component
MVSTRSNKTAQTQLEDGTVTTSTSRTKAHEAATRKSPSEANTATKRKAPHTVKAQKSTVKRTKTEKPVSKTTKTNDTRQDSKIIINRAPVLQLWSACVTHQIYPELSWESCLSTGSAISTICAVAKGRSIGTVPEKDKSNEKAEKHEQARKKRKDLKHIEVMNFKLKLKDGLALVGSEGDGKPGAEEALKKRFGAEQYDMAREAFEKALMSWQGEEIELNKQAFGFYEKFRPDIQGGQKGWGRRGEVDLEEIKGLVSR